MRATASSTLQLHGLAPNPGAEWQRLLDFVGFKDGDKIAMSRTVEALLQRAHVLVAGTYNHLLSVPETAAILGWEQGLDEAHLEERRRFFTIWLCRTLGADTSDEFAFYLFRAGKYHAGHGPRHIHVPPAYVTASVGRAMAAFAHFMDEAQLPANHVARAMAGWNKYLAVQLHMMMLGYQVAREYDNGDLRIPISLFGRLRSLLGLKALTAHARHGDAVGEVLRKLFSYYPHACSEALERVWQSEERQNSLWTEVSPAYVLRSGWRVLVNGRDVSYDGLSTMPLHAEDKIAIFPPGR